MIMKRILFSRLTCLAIALGYFFNLSAQQYQARNQVVIEKLVYGKIYNQSKGSQYPASYKRIVLLPNTAANLSMAQDLYNPFDDATIKKIRGARTVLTSQEGIYEFANVNAGNYIIRVTGMGGMVIKFSIPTNSYARKRIPDMPSDYYKKVSDRRFVKIN
jgi:hypothetical protein